MSPAQASDVEITSLSSLIELGLKNSFDQSAANYEAKAKERDKIYVDRTQNIPQINLDSSLQKYNYDSPYMQNGQLVSNNGNQPNYGLTISYDLQNLINGKRSFARQSLALAKIKQEIARRNVVRDIKIGYYTIIEIQSEIDILAHLISFFSRVDKVLQKEKKLGVYNEIQREQFKVQKSVLKNNLQVRRTHLAAAYLQLSVVMNVPSQNLEKIIPKIKQTPILFYAKQQVVPDKLANLKDKVILGNLAGQYNLAKVKYENYNSSVLPKVFLSGTRQLPSMPSSNGPQTVTAIGVSFPIDSFFTRSSNKSQLEATVSAEKALFDKSMLDYKNQIKLSAINLNIYKNQAKDLDSGRLEAKDLLDDSFLFFSQKRINALGVLSISQNYFQTSRNVFNNKLQIQIYDTQLEYLLGKGVE